MSSLLANLSASEWEDTVEWMCKRSDVILNVDYSVKRIVPLNEGVLQIREKMEDERAKAHAVTIAGFIKI